jgi:hypothetical protein
LDAITWGFGFDLNFFHEILRGFKL